MRVSVHHLVPVCGELLFMPQRAIGTGLCSDSASGKNLELKLWVVSSQLCHPVCYRPTHMNESDD